LPPLSNPEEDFLTGTAIARACSMHTDYNRKKVDYVTSR
jgi:hypothetical protein